MTTMIEHWRKSTRSSSQTNCVEVSNLGALRDSKNPAGPALSVDLVGFLAAVKAGRFDR
jgi:Domain of unknown function (DUF397)